MCSWHMYTVECLTIQHDWHKVLKSIYSQIFEFVKSFCKRCNSGGSACHQQWCSFSKSHCCWTTFGRFARSSLFTGCRLVDIKKRICLPRMTPTDQNHPFPKFLQLLAPGCLAGLVVKEKIVILVIIVIIVTKGWPLILPTSGLPTGRQSRFIDNGGTGPAVSFVFSRQKTSKMQISWVGWSTRYTN